MRRVLPSIFLALSPFTAFSQDTVPFVFPSAPGPSAGNPAGSKSGSEPEERPDCSLAKAGLPKDTIVVAAGSYAGRKTGFQMAGEPEMEATQFDVAVHSDKPIALLLGAYEPTIWAIGWTKQTNIVAVFATGYHRQAVAGLPKGTPLLTSTYKGKEGCGAHYLSVAADLDWLNPKSRELFGLPVERVHLPNPNGLIDIVESSRPKTAYVTSPHTPAASFRDKNAPPAGQAGLQLAVSKGLIRPANPLDIETVKAHYEELASKTKPKRDLPPVAGQAEGMPKYRLPPMNPGHTYVVLKDFRIPVGLTGVNQTSFVVPKGNKPPSGNPGFTVVIDLNKAIPCSGVFCR